jgi:hypothetical protein
MQEMGEALIGGLTSMSRALSARDAAGLLGNDSFAQEAARQRSVYMDLLGLYMVSPSSFDFLLMSIWQHGLLCLDFHEGSH